MIHEYDEIVRAIEVVKRELADQTARADKAEAGWRVSQHQLANAIAERDKARGETVAALNERDDAIADTITLNDALVEARRDRDIAEQRHTQAIADIRRRDALIGRCADVVAAEVQRLEEWGSYQHAEQYRDVLRHIAALDQPEATDASS